ncbi:TetR/AcrR family transcriptional regulator [Salibacterium qingdaonense]|uniref:TetR/AcrR family transcriptional regulator n=1 Tax=Salibacterium qingdaonense TaxID=266892 RepID=UPI001160AFDC|nr:TetR/AcrR family transcriptional regulator [Salibacterium qingdaonense]
MSEKQQEIMDTAIELFSEKGYYFTSIQEITEACGISKGAFYRHFASKEGMMLALLESHQNTLLREAEWYSSGKDLSAHEQLISKIRLELEKSVEYRSFFRILFTEFMPTENSEVNKKIKEFQTVLRSWHQQSLEDAFGSDIAPFLQDVTAVMEGVLKEYVMLLMWYSQPVPLWKVAAFIFETVHALVRQLPQLEPVLPAGIEDTLEAVSGRAGMKKEMQLLLTEVSSRYAKEDIHQDKQTMELVLEELEHDHPRVFLIEALLEALQQRSYVSRRIEDIIRIWKEWKGDVLNHEFPNE